MSARRVLVIGSQAIHAFHRDPPIAVVFGSREVDVTPLPYADFDRWYFYVHEHFGADSEFDIEHGVYIDMVKEGIPKFPSGWETRAIERSLDMNEPGQSVTVVYPEIYDLLITKLLVNRDQDEVFLKGVAQITTLDADTLRARLDSVVLTREKEHRRVWARECVRRVFAG